MALDGTKIIAGDLAHDVYNDFMDWYDEGLLVDDIKLNIIAKYHYKGCPDWDFEIWFTVLSLALWETGNLTNEDMEGIKLIVKKGAGVQMWEEISKELGKARKKELDDFITKISKPKAKPRLRRKYRIIKNFHFQENDILAFQSMDGTWRASILVSIHQYRNKCTYYLMPTTYQGIDKPSQDDIFKTKGLFSKSLCALDSEDFINQKKVLEKLYNIDRNVERGFRLGHVVTGVGHQALRNFAMIFEVIGKATLMQPFNVSGSFGWGDNQEGFIKHNHFHLESTRYELVPLKLVLEEE